MISEELFFPSVRPSASSALCAEISHRALCKSAARAGCWEGGTAARPGWGQTAGQSELTRNQPVSVQVQQSSAEGFWAESKVLPLKSYPKSVLGGLVGCPVPLVCMLAPSHFSCVTSGTLQPASEPQLLQLQSQG